VRLVEDLNPQPSLRSSGPSQAYTDAATQLINDIKAGSKSLAKIVAVLQNVIPGITVETEEDGSPNMQSLAVALRQHRLGMVAASKSSLGI